MVLSLALALSIHNKQQEEVVLVQELELFQVPKEPSVYEERRFYSDLDLNVSKTSVLPKGVTQQAAFDVVQNIIQATPTLTHLIGDVVLVSFCPEGFVGIGVPIGTHVFVQNFVPKTCGDYYR
jgi:hypothetical protein